MISTKNLRIVVFDHFEVEVVDLVVALWKTRQQCFTEFLMAHQMSYLISMLPPMFPAHSARIYVNPLVTRTTQPLSDNTVSHFEAPLDGQVKCSPCL